MPLDLSPWLEGPVRVHCPDAVLSAGVARVTLARPERRNAFDADTIERLTRAFHALALQPSLRVVVLDAQGDLFCAGADLNWMRQAAEQSWYDNHADATRLADLFAAVAECPVPVIARVQGDCYGGGVGLAACADLVVAAPEAGFRLSEVKLGLIPATISPYVVKALGERAARRYFVTAERFDALRARELGLVHEVRPAAELDAAVHDLARAIAANAPQAVRLSKQLASDVAGRPITAELRDDTARRIADVRASEEGREGLRAFLERDTPAWLRTPD